LSTGKRAGYRGLDKLAVHRGHLVGSATWYAAKIVEQIAALRCALADGRHDEIVHEAVHLGALLKEADIVVPHGYAFDRGYAMQGGPKHRRRHILGSFADEALEQLGPDASTQAALNYLQDTEKVFVDRDGSIDWRNARGAEKTTMPKTFRNRLTIARKKLRGKLPTK
jgi:hypothetical protein